MTFSEYRDMSIFWSSRVCIIELGGGDFSFHMPRAQRFPVEYQWCLMEYKRWTGIMLCATDWPWLMFWPTSTLNHMILFWSGGMHQKMWPNSDCIPSEYLRVYTCPEHHWLALYKLASIKLKGTIPVKIVLIITSIYPCIRACFNWFFLFELKNIIELIWITGCFASVHQHSPNNTCRYQGNMITVFVCFSTINYFNAFMLIFTQKQTTLCISQQHNN